MGVEGEGLQPHGVLEGHVGEIILRRGIRGLHVIHLSMRWLFDSILRSNATYLLICYLFYFSNAHTSNSQLLFTHT